MQLEVENGVPDGKCGTPTRRYCCMRRSRFECVLFWCYTWCFRLSPFYYDQVDTLANRLSQDEKDDGSEEEEGGGKDGDSDRKALLKGRPRQKRVEMKGLRRFQ